MSVETIAAASVPAIPVEADAPPITSQWTLMRRRFFKHRLAAAGLVVVAFFYFVAIFADFLAYSDPAASNASRSLAPPQPVRFFDEGRFFPHALGLSRARDPATFDLRYAPDPSVKIPITLFARGYRYKFLGLVDTDIHLVGAVGAQTETNLFLFGADTLGRDLFSRLLVGIRTSLFIGLAAVFVTLTLGMLMGTLSGYYGGAVDLVIQRIVEILRAVPTIPLWMGLAAAIPADWSVTAVYFTITIIIALIGWTELARELRGRIMALKHEDFVLAAELSGARPRRIMFVHLLPSCTSHIIATTTLALPAMIASETALGFLGLGLRPPAISLGVLLNDAQSVQAMALYPWLIIPAIPTAVVIIAFNFLGDGLRDAADPYA